MTSPGKAWCRITAILLFSVAAVAEKPVVVYYRPAVCVDEKTRTRRCEQFAESVAHPAMQRRLAAVDFKVVGANEGEAASVAVEDPSGREVMRWILMPDWLTLAEILALIEIATPHVMEAHRAAIGDEPFIVEREDALMALALGDKTRGRQRLEAMSTSESNENRELAAIWLERLAALEPNGQPKDEVFDRYARRGTTDRVRFEAWMALGDVKVEQDSFDEAIGAYNRAVEFGAGRFSRLNALAARQTAADLASPVVGLGAPGAVVAGRKSIQPRKVSKNVASVEYKLDGKVIATARRKPFATALNFGRIPRRQLLELTFRNRGGSPVDRALIVVNERSEAFDVDFIAPRRSAYLNGEVDVYLTARVPRGRAVDHLVVEWKGKRVSRLTAPPYRTRIDVENGEQGLLRAVLRLDDGSEVEDVFMVNTPMLFEAGAHLVEVPAYFDLGVPAMQDVVIREAATTRPVDRIIRPEDAPLLIALLIDSSASMTPHMLDVQEAAVRFVERNIEPRDRAMVVAFSSTARVLLRPSSDRPAVLRSILSIHPRGGTALNDAMVNALLQLHTSGSRKALVVFSDGLDGNSVFSSADVTEVARRAGVPIYTLAFLHRAPDQKVEHEETVAAKRHLSTLAAGTGGKAFEIETLDGLDAVWNEIGQDLRRQSLVIYRTKTAGEEWRTLEVSVKGRGSKVRAPSGVFITTEADRD